MKSMKGAGWRNETLLQPGSFTCTGRGVYSQGSINPEEPLIELPYNSIICLATIENDFAFKELIKAAIPKLTNKISTQCLLAFYLLYRKHHNPNDGYCCSIPDAFTNPYFCTKSELMILPESLFDRILQQGQEISSSFALFSTALLSKTCLCCSRQYFPDIFSIASYKWAYFAVNSRSVFIDPTAVKRASKSHDIWTILRDQPKTALTPFLDLMNHSDLIEPSRPEFFVPLGHKPSLNANLAYKLYSGQSFRRYEQIFISYGRLDNTRLLLDYGFILAPNRHDCVRLEMSDITSYLETLEAKRRHPSIQSNKFKFIKENSLGDEMFVSRSDGLSHNMLVVLSILFVEQLAHFSNILSQVGFGDVPPLEPIASVARYLLEFKSAKYKLVRDGLKRCGENSSESGAFCLSYVEECIRLIGDVLADYLNGK